MSSRRCESRRSVNAFTTLQLGDARDDEGAGSQGVLARHYEADAWTVAEGMPSTTRAPRRRRLWRCRWGLGALES